MTTSLSQGGIATSCELARAILLYTSGTGEALATVHEIAEGALLPGTPLDRNGLVELVATLSGPTGVRTILPERVLYSDASTLLWWCPSARRPIHFKSGKKELDEEISGKEVLHPPLVFLARQQSLSVWALRDNERPMASTQLFVAPYFNVYASGAMCSGNIRLPDSISPSNKNLKEWELAFFETNFTHSNLDGKKITSFPGGHTALWKELTSPSYEHFPVGALAPLASKLTLEKALIQGAQS